MKTRPENTHLQDAMIRNALCRVSAAISQLADSIEVDAIDRDLVLAVRSIAQDAADGILDPANITRETIAQRLRLLHPQLPQT